MLRHGESTQHKKADYSFGEPPYRPLVGLILTEEEARFFVNSKFSLEAGGLCIAMVEVRSGIITRAMNQREAQVYLSRPKAERDSLSHRLAIFRTRRT